MDLVVVGINHKTAPVEIREKFSFKTKRIFEVNRLLKEGAGLKESLILSTCNRVEIYAVANHHQDHLSQIEGFLGRYHNLDMADYRQKFYVYRGREVIEHLFKVAAGLDSMVIGEMEILGQVKRAYEEARESSTTGKVLNRLFEKTFNTAKKIRTETAITRGAVSVSSVAVRLAKKILGKLADKKVLVIGTGQVGEQLAVYLKKEGIKTILVTNRTYAKAKDLAARFNAQAVAFEEFRSRLVEMDIVITSTGAPHYIISRDEIASLMRPRRQRPVFLIDLAVPRDVDEAVNKIDNVYLYNIDDLQKTVDETITLRKNELDSCLKIIAASSQRFLQWLASERL